ncbi:15-hydroxyprostaglandin dehydrogenase [NAD(+)]-like [Haliotis rubra]|uniref:15-hydroxyprostaglandin dehydrogenase [NAD(+)]-like n=1 Tax=Haliotis rubra TaxID=36100 RepID=UPI001EE610FF|nr:15-hydroxyprostaglandin dehydrogenase [NAD(+)]-like [Haliotis rubra]
MGDEVALVTGAAQGLGRGFTEALLRRGAKVCVADVKVQTGEATVLRFQQQFGRDRVFFFKCDVTCEADVKAAVQATRDRFGKLTIMVNNAGISSEAQWSKMVDVNLKGVIDGTQEAVAVMRRDTGGQGGVVVNIASAAGLIPVHTTPVYAATKFGVVGFTRSWAANPHLASLGISFACICPTFTDTDMIVHGDFREGRSLYTEDSQRMMAEVGVMPLSQVVTAFEQLLDSPDNNGIVMSVTNIKGVRVRKHGRPSRL